MGPIFNKWTGQGSWWVVHSIIQCSFLGGRDAVTCLKVNAQIRALARAKPVRFKQTCWRSLNKPGVLFVGTMDESYVLVHQTMHYLTASFETISR